MAGRDHTTDRRNKRRAARAKAWALLVDLEDLSELRAGEAISRVLAKLTDEESDLAVESPSATRSISQQPQSLSSTIESGATRRSYTADEVPVHGALFDLTPPKRNGKPFRSCTSELEFAKQIKARFNDAFGAKVEAPVTPAQSKAIFKFKRKYGEAAARIAPWVQRMTKTVNGSDWKASLTNLYGLAVIPPREHPYWEWLEMRHETHRETNPQVTELMKKWGDLELYKERFPRRDGA